MLWACYALAAAGALSLLVGIVALAIVVPIIVRQQRTVEQEIERVREKITKGARIR